jgi:hypothetical protein
MRANKILLANLAFSGVSVLASVVVSMVLAYFAALLRGNTMPNGSELIDGPTSIATMANFRAFSPYAVAFAVIAGVVIGQVQFRAWFSTRKGAGA